MLGFDVYNFYSIAPSLVIVATTLVMMGFGIRFIRQQMKQDAIKIKAD